MKLKLKFIIFRALRFPGLKVFYCTTRDVKGMQLLSTLSAFTRILLMYYGNPSTFANEPFALGLTTFGKS